MPSLRSVLATCGNGAMGRLGHGLDCASQSLPRIVGSLVGSDVKAVACGGAHTVVLTGLLLLLADDGSVLTFGANSQGQLGHSEKDKFIPVPLEVGLPDSAVAVAAGEQHTLCLTKGGEVWAWGSNASGQLGIGPTDKARVPEPRLVKPLTGVGVEELAAGSEHSLARSTSGQLWSWGTSTQGALGQGGP
ncbi:hypothetical protein QJQ45_018482, partial [Haematococcus lacustris]